MRAGWLLGGRFLMITHRGRKTGRLRRTVVEVIARDAEHDAYFVAAPWAPRADWYQNILHRPHVRITVGNRRFRAVARPLSPAESRLHLEEYAARHRLAAKALARALGVTREQLLDTQVVEFRRETKARAASLTPASVA